MAGFLKYALLITFAKVVLIFGTPDRVEYLDWWPFIRGSSDELSVVADYSIYSREKGWSNTLIIDNFDSDCEKLKAHTGISYGSILNLRECVNLANTNLSNINLLKEKANKFIGEGIEIKILKLNRLKLGFTWNDKDQAHLMLSDGFHNLIEFKRTLGINWYLSVQEIHSKIVHNIAWSYGSGAKFDILHHSEIKNQNGSWIEPSPYGRQVRILSYNIWNTMPHLTSDWSYESRWDRYSKRIEWLIEQVKHADADIICFQEVRYDWTLPPDYQNQMSTLTSTLLPMGFKYFVFQPAMTYMSKNVFLPEERTEEGVAIFSKFPIISSSYKLLSREIGNALDEHQRLVLHARIDFNNLIVDVFTTHFSLNTESRVQSAIEVVKFANEKMESEDKPASLQVLTGDFNGEATDLSIRFLQGLISKEGIRSTFKDAWLENFKEPRPRSYTLRDMQNAFTFPSDEPKKRIDFVFYRGSSNNRIDIENFELIGREPKEMATIKKVGMEKPGSAIYASDHRGVLFTAKVHDKKECNEDAEETCHEIQGSSSIMDISKECIVNLKGKRWTASFIYGAYTSREDGGFREKGARYDAYAVSIIQEGTQTKRKCVVNIFENGDWSGASLTLSTPGEYVLKAAGFAGKKVEAIEILLQ